jgi:glycine hydroxymethyltransferase
VTGKDAEARCGEAGITLNKNAIPNDPQPPAIASGIRVGTPAVTTQGLKEDEMKDVASLIARAVRGEPADAIRREVASLVERYPAYPRG